MSQTLELGFTAFQSLFLLFLQLIESLFVEVEVEGGPVLLALHLAPTTAVGLGFAVDAGALEGDLPGLEHALHNTVTDRVDILLLTQARHVLVGEHSKIVDGFR